MCCRFYYDYDVIRPALKEEGVFCPESPSGMICPGKEALVLRRANEAVTAEQARWGFGDIINARSESYLVKPLFGLASRCILPAISFYEWDSAKDLATFSFPGGQVIFLAGLWKIIENDPRFVVLTTKANESMKPVHDRMPLLISRKNIKPWLFDDSAAKDLASEKMPELIVKRDVEQMMLF